MEALSLELFTQVGIDFEVRRYHILDDLKDIKRYFSQNELYPHLSEFVDLYSDLKNVADRIGQMEQRMPLILASIFPSRRPCFLWLAASLCSNCRRKKENNAGERNPYFLMLLIPGIHCLIGSDFDDCQCASGYTDQPSFFILNPYFPNMDF